PAGALRPRAQDASVPPRARGHEPGTLLRSDRRRPRAADGRRPDARTHRARRVGDRPSARLRASRRRRTARARRPDADLQDGGVTRFAAVLATLLLAACRSAPPAVYSGAVSTSRGEFVVCGDTRGWMMGELWRAPSGFERRAVFDRLAEERPDFVLNTGDL